MISFRNLVANGWTAPEKFFVDGNNTHVTLSVLAGADGVPERISVRDDSHEVGHRAVAQWLSRAGLTARVSWEAGEAEDESVAFLRAVSEVQA